MAYLFVAMFACAVVMWALMLLVVPAVLFGIFLAVYVALGALLGSGDPQPETTTPDDVVAGRVRLPMVRKNAPYPADWAWPSYLVAQSWCDVWAALAAGFEINHRGWVRVRNIARRNEEMGALRLVLWVPWLAWCVVTFGELLGAAITVTVLALVWAFCVVGWTSAAIVLRVYDRVARRVLRAQASCPACYYVMNVPAYRCDSCARVHRDIRPGALGAAWRSCGCGRRLPTTARRAARRLASQCQRCDGPLREGAAVLTDIRIPVFGPMSAGKTRLVHAGLVASRDRLATQGDELEFVDAASRQLFEHGEEIIGNCDDTAKTQAGRLPPAITARVSVGRRCALVHLFDAAGEFFTDREDNSELEFLEHAGGLVLVVDPFSIPWVREQLGDAKELLAAAQPATDDPERGYRVTAQRMRDYGVNTGRRAVAVVVVKADLLSEFCWAADLFTASARDWLVRTGMDNLVLAVERDFAEAQFFVVSSMTGTQPGSRLSPAAPLLWLVSRGMPSPFPGDDRTLQEVA